MRGLDGRAFYRGLVRACFSEFMEGLLDGGFALSGGVREWWEGGVYVREFVVEGRWVYLVRVEEYGSGWLRVSAWRLA